MLKKLLITALALPLLLISIGAILPIVNAADLEAKLIVPIGEIRTFEQASIPNYITTVYKWGIGAAALLAVLMLVVGGLQYVLSAGNLGSTEAAKQRITSAILGVALLLGISLILSIIDPKLTFINITGKQDVAYKSDIGWAPESIAGLIDTSKKLDFSSEKSISALALDAENLEQAVRNSGITTSQYNAARTNIKKQFNAYFDSPEYRAEVEKTGTAAAKLGGGPPTKDALDKQIKKNKEAAWSTITKNSGWLGRSDSSSPEKDPAKSTPAPATGGSF